MLGREITLLIKRRSTRATLVASIAVGLISCEPAEPTDAPDASLSDRDAGPVRDGGIGRDAGLVMDGGVGSDSGVDRDAGAIDSGPRDAGMAVPWCETWNVCGNQQIVFSDDFENGFGAWSVEGGSWDIGAPAFASGPTAHGGANVAGTVLDGVYPASNQRAGVLLISPEIQIPIASENPRLRFWIWSVLRDGHSGSVQIREVGGNWTSLDRLEGNNGQWRQGRLDLSLWAERTVQIGFHLNNFAGSTAVPRAGIYVDDISVETGPAAAMDPDGFEGGYGDWSVTGGVWHIGSPIDTEGPRAHGGTSLAGTVLDEAYPWTSYRSGAWLVSPEFRVPNAELNPHVRFWIWSHLRDGHSATIQVREVGSVNWTVLDTLGGDNGQWRQERINLASWAERTIQIGFHLNNFAGSGAVPRPGFFVDDFSLETGPSSLADLEGFENGYGDWAVLGGVWDIGIPTNSGGPESHGGTSLAGTVLDDTYPATSSRIGAWLISPEFRVPGSGSSPAVNVWVWAHLRDGHSATIQIREVGRNWTELDRFTGDNGRWVQKRFSLVDWSDRDVQVGFHLNNFAGANAVPRPGFYVDDFSVTSN